MILKHILFFGFMLLQASWCQELFYGRETLENLNKYGLDIRVSITDDLKHHKNTIRDHLNRRLVRRGITMEKSSSVVLKLSIKSISSDDGFYVAYINLELHQTANLASNNKSIEAPTWDAWKMGEYREQDIIKEVDDLARLFTNDYLYGN